MVFEPNQSLVKSPKLYLCDTGLLCYLVGVNGLDYLLDSPYAGSVWESFVCAELRKKLRHTGRGQLFYWRDRTKEADFLIHKAGRFEILDAKWTEHPDAKDATALERVAAELPRGTVKRQAIVGRSENPYPLRGSVEAVPIEDA